MHCAKLMKSATAPMCNNARMTVALRVKHQCMARCDKLLACLVNLLLTLNFHPLGTNLLPLAITLRLSTARKVPGSLKAWLSMPPQTATCITVPIVTAAVTPSPRMDRTRKCTSRVTSLPRLGLVRVPMSL
jgi:hypothetical protein